MKDFLQETYDKLVELEAAARKLPNKNFADIVKSVSGRLMQLRDHPDADVVSAQLGKEPVGLPAEQLPPYATDQQRMEAAAASEDEAYRRRVAIADEAARREVTDKHDAAVAAAGGDQPMKVTEEMRQAEAQRQADMNKPWPTPTPPPPASSVPFPNPQKY